MALSVGPAQKNIDEINQLAAAQQVSKDSSTQTSPFGNAVATTIARPGMSQQGADAATIMGLAAQYAAGHPGTYLTDGSVSMFFDALKDPAQGGMSPAEAQKDLTAIMADAATTGQGKPSGLADDLNSFLQSIGDTQAAGPGGDASSWYNSLRSEFTPTGTT